MTEAQLQIQREKEAKAHAAADDNEKAQILKEIELIKIGADDKIAKMRATHQNEIKAISVK